MWTPTCKFQIWILSPPATLCLWPWAIIHDHDQVFHGRGDSGIPGAFWQIHQRARAICGMGEYPGVIWSPSWCRLSSFSIIYIIIMIVIILHHCHHLQELPPHSILSHSSLTQTSSTTEAKASQTKMIINHTWYTNDWKSPLKAMLDQLVVVKLNGALATALGCRWLAILTILIIMIMIWFEFCQW